MASGPGHVAASKWWPELTQEAGGQARIRRPQGWSARGGSRPAENRPSLWPKVSPSAAEPATCSGSWLLFPETAFSVLANPHCRPGRFFLTNPLAAPIPVDRLFLPPRPPPRPHSCMLCHSTFFPPKPRSLGYHTQHEAGFRCAHGQKSVVINQAHQDQGSEAIPGNRSPQEAFLNPSSSGHKHQPFQAPKRLWSLLCERALLWA